MAFDVTALPFVDEHHVVVAAPAGTVWRHVGAVMGRTGAADCVAASILATVPRRASGDLLVRGGTVPGFSAEEAVCGDRLVLGGRHRFSEYALIFELTEEQPGGTRLAAVTRARFPGIRGRLYRAVVIGSGGHKVLVRRMLRGIQRAAEASEGVSDPGEC